GNHEVMVRGTLANIRIRNRIVEGVEGGFTKHFPDGETLSIYDASMKYQGEGVPLVIVAGEEDRGGAVARLGGEGDPPPRGEGGHRRELRADPPVDPRGNGRGAAPVPGGRERADARTRRHGDAGHRGDRPGAGERVRGGPRRQDCGL